MSSAQAQHDAQRIREDAQRIREEANGFAMRSVRRFAASFRDRTQTRGSLPSAQLSLGRNVIPPQVVDLVTMFVIAMVTASSGCRSRARLAV